MSGFQLLTAEGLVLKSMLTGRYMLRAEPGIDSVKRSSVTSSKMSCLSFIYLYFYHEKVKNEIKGKNNFTFFLFKMQNSEPTFQDTIVSDLLNLDRVN